jgi:hypothetical protein
LPLPAQTLYTFVLASVCVLRGAVKDEVAELAAKHVVLLVLYHLRLVLQGFELKRYHCGTTPVIQLVRHLRKNHVRERFQLVGLAVHNFLTDLRQ